MLKGGGGNNRNAQFIPLFITNLRKVLLLPLYRGTEFMSLDTIRHYLHSTKNISMILIPVENYELTKILFYCMSKKS